MQKHEWKNDPARCLKNKRLGLFNKLASKIYWGKYYNVTVTGKDQYNNVIVDEWITRERTFLGKIIHFIFRKRWKRVTKITVQED